MTRHPFPALFFVLTACSSHTPQGSYQGHGAGSLSEETLRRFAPPPLDPHLRARVETRLDLRSPGIGQITPDGKRLFFTWDVTGSRQVWRLDSPLSFPVQLTAGEDPTLLKDITPDGKTLVLSRDRGGEEYPGLYLQPVGGGALQVIQHKPKVQTVFQFTEESGAGLWFTANDVDPASRAIYRYDFASKAIVPKFAEPGLWGISDHTNDGRLLLEKATGALAREYYEWDPKTRGARPLFGLNENVEYDAQYGARPGEYIVLTNKLGEFRRLYRWTETKKELVPILPESKYDVASFSVDRARKRILYSTNEGGYTRLHALDARNFKSLSLPTFSNAEHVYAGGTTRNGRFTSVGVETAQAPRASYVLDWSSGKLTRWVLPSSPEVDTSRFLKAEIEFYPARDGTRIPMIVRRPSACRAPTKPCPVILRFHGGPEGQSTPGFAPGSELYLEEGFIVAEPNVRGSDGYGKSWSHADDAAKRLDVITDIEDAAIFVKQAWAAGGVAPKVGILGGSYGGYSALMGMTRFAGAFDAGVAIVGMSNLLTFLENTAPYRRALRISEYGDPVKDRDALLKLSPITYVAQVKSPLLIIQGANDPRVPAGEAVQIHEALQKRGVASELMIFADEGHGAHKRANEVFQMGHTLRFFEQHLK